MMPGASLSLSVAAMNTTAGPRGLVPTLLVFGVHTQPRQEGRARRAASRRLPVIDDEGNLRCRLACRLGGEGIG